MANFTNYSWPACETLGAAPTSGASGTIREPGTVVRVGTTYYEQVGTLAAPVWVLAKPVTAQEREAAYLQSKLGFTNPIWVPWFPARDPATFLAGVGGTSVVSGLGELASTAAAAGSYAAAYQTASATTGYPIAPVAGGASGSWGFVAVFKINTAIVTETVDCNMGICNQAANKYLRVGGCGAVSAVNFALKTDASGNLDSGVALDTAVHTHRVYRTGTTTTWELDGTVVGSGNIYPAADNHGLVYQVYDTGGAAVRSATLYWAATLTESP